MKYFQLLILLVAATTVTGQEDDTKLSNELTRDATRKSFINDSRAGADSGGTLAAGGAFYISNPSPTYKVDLKKAYHNPEWQSGVVRLLNGESYEAQLRFRVIDQSFEILHNDESYELKKRQVEEVTIGKDRFVMMPDPLLKKRGRHIYQLHYDSKQYQLTEHHSTQWQDPPKQGIFDTKDQHRSIKSKKQLIFRTSNKIHLIKSSKDLLEALGLDKKSDAFRYVKAQKLKLNRAEDIVEFLTQLEKELTTN